MRRRQRKALDLTQVEFAALVGCVVINASLGLGESIVGGIVTPDSYVVPAADLTIVSQQIAEKRRMTIPVAGGTREVDVPRFLRVRPALSDEQVAELGRLGLALQAAMGAPVDVECAYQAGRLYLLQCRPITALPHCNYSGGGLHGGPSKPPPCTSSFFFRIAVRGSAGRKKGSGSFLTASPSKKNQNVFHCRHQIAQNHR